MAHGHPRSIETKILRTALGWQEKGTATPETELLLRGIVLGGLVHAFSSPSGNLRIYDVLHPDDPDPSKKVGVVTSDAEDRILAYTPREWRAFLDGVKKEEFDDLL